MIEKIKTFTSTVVDTTPLNVIASKVNDLVDAVNGQEYMIKTIMAYEKPKEKAATKAFDLTPTYSDDKSNLTESLLTLHADMNQVAGVLVALINRHRRQERIAALKEVRSLIRIEPITYTAIDKLIEECK